MSVRAPFTLRYAVRSIRRGGQRSVLAVFCIAVGVLAVVALRLAGDMITDSLTTNVRQLVGGDLTLQSTRVTLGESDLARFETLRSEGLVTRYLPIGLERATARRDASGSSIARLTVDVVDAAAYPLTGDSDLSEPAGATYASALSPAGSVVVSEFAASQLAAHVGDRVRLTLLDGGSAVVTVRAIARNNIVSGGGGAVGYITRTQYASMSTRTLRYGTVDALTPDTNAAATAADRLRSDFPTANVLTVQDALDQNLTASNDISHFLQIVGLLALLLGGIGIVNTMQVSLSRRRVEIAMLKTTGYRRRDLYMLFGTEAALLGLAGGALGTILGVGASAVVRVLVERVFMIDIVFTIKAESLLAGVAVGISTALIFGLLPIVRAAAVRPLVVLRDLPVTGGAQSVAQTATLYALLILLFAALSAGLLGSWALAIGYVAGTVVVLALLAGVFWLVLLGVGALPVPERPRAGHVALVSVAVVLSALVAVRFHGIGAVLLVAAVCGYIAAFLPRRQKTAVMLALRSIRRTRGRTSTTLVALFVGVFGIGLILVLGQDVTDKIDSSINTLSSFNVFVVAPPAQAQTVRSVTGSLDGVQERRITSDVTVAPQAVDGRPISTYLPATRTPDREDDFRLGALTGVEGYDLAARTLPDTTADSGRVLRPADAGTTNAMGQVSLTRSPFNLHVGSTVTVTQATTRKTVTLTLVGFYAPVARSSSGLTFRTFFQPLVVDRGVADNLGAPTEVQTIVSLKLDPSRKAAALARLERAAPTVAVIDLADIGATVRQVLSNLVVLLVALASLALLAGLVIIGNTVALAMLERRREMGVLKAVGHSSRSVLAQVLVENGIVATIGGLSGMIVVTVATTLLGTYVLSTDLAVGTPIVLAVIAGVLALSVAVAAAVAWSPVRVRPLEVLRYE